MLAAAIIFTFYLPMANDLSFIGLILCSLGLEIVLGAFGFAENQDEMSLGFYLMAKGKSRVPKPYQRLDKYQV